MIVTILLLGSVISVLHIRYVNKKEFVESSKQLVEQTSSMLEFWIEDQIRIVKQVAKNETVVSLCLDPENEGKQKIATDYLNELNTLYPYYENLPISVILDEPITVEVNEEKIIIDNGEFLTDTVNGDTIGKGGMDYSYVSKIVDGNPYFISEIYRSIWRENPIFVVSAPVIIEDVLEGIAIISPQMDYFTKIFVDSITVGKTGYMFLVDDSGEIIAHNNRELILSDSKADREFAKKIVSRVESGEMFFEDNYKMTEKYYYGKKINLEASNTKNDMYVFFTQNKVEIYQSVHGFALVSLVVILVTSALIYRLYVLLSKYQYQKIREQHLVDANNDLEIEVKKRTRELEDMTKRDSMTNLYNHKYIYEYLNHKIGISNVNKKIVAAIIDIDDFKKINDNYGHQIGDEVIKAVSNSLVNSLRDNDLVGRYGGEEFLILLCDIEFEECLNILERIRKDIHTQDIDNLDYHISISIGVSQWHGDSTTELIKRADKMMYKAKFFGKNQIVHDNV